MSRRKAGPRKGASRQSEMQALQEHNAALRQQVTDLTARSAVWEKAHAALAAHGGRVAAAAPDPGSIAIWQRVLSFTTKQHCALQMILGHCSNEDIARRMGVTESTAKVYVRAMFGKLRIHSRMEFISLVKPVFEQIPDAEYERAAGIPKTWHANWAIADPYKNKYFGVMR